MTTRLEQHGDVKVRVHKASAPWRYQAQTQRRYVVTCGTQLFLADANDDVGAVQACGFSRFTIDDGDVKVRLAEPADVDRIVDILELELEVKSWPKPAERPKVRRLRPAPRYNAGRPVVPELFGGKVAA